MGVPAQTASVEASGAFDCGSDVIVEFVRASQSCADPNDLQFTRCDLSGGFVPVPRGGQFSFVTSEHSPKDRDSALFLLCMTAAQAYETRVDSGRRLGEHRDAFPCCAYCNSSRKPPILGESVS